MLNSREIAVLIWGFVLVFVMLVKKDVRHSMFNVLKSVIGILLNPIGMFTVFYIAIMFLVMYLVKVVNGELIKDYFVWIFTGLFPLMFKVATDYRTTNVSKVVSGVFKFSIIPMFIVSEYTLPLWAELILVPFIALISMMVVIAEREVEYTTVRKLLNFILGACGIVIIYFAVKGFYLHLSDAKKAVFWEKMFIDLIGITLHLPLLYLTQILSLYEQIIIRTKLKKKRDKFRAILIIFKHCFFNKTRLVDIQQQIFFKQTETVKQFSKSI